MNHTNLTEEQTLEEARTFLRGARAAHDLVTRDLERITRLEAVSQRMTSRLQEVRVQTSLRADALEEAVIELTEAREQLNRDMGEEIRLSLSISHVIDALPDEKERQVLEKKYLAYMSWDQMERELFYGRRWLQTLHQRALEHVAALLAAQEARGEERKSA